MKKPIKIDKKIPIPDRYKNGKIVKLKYPLHKMEVGDSFLIPAKTEKEKSRISRNICTIWVNWVKKQKNKLKFTTKREDGGIRIWRIK